MPTRGNPEPDANEDGGEEGVALGGPVTVGAALGAILVEVRELVAGFDPAVVSAGDAAVLVERFAELERLAAGGRLLAAGRMARTSVWAGSGDGDVTEWMARTTGQSRSDARKDLAAARVLDELDGTQDALRQGRLTKEQVREIAPAAKAAPGAEGGLLEEAARGSVEGLARKARAAKAAARGDGRDAVERVRRRRCVTHGRSEDGSAWLRASGPPDDIARILAGLAPWAEQTRRAARGRGEVLTDDQASFDGLVAVAAQPVPRVGDSERAVPAPGADSGDDDEEPGVTAGPGSPRWATKVIVNVDLAALRRGFTIAGERCEITGIGPVPVATVDDLLARDDTFLAAVVREGTDIQKVAHFGRAPTAAQRTALEADHATCCIDGCPDPPRVIDHHHRFADDGPRTLANLGPLCDDHDHRKTHDRWVLVRHGRSRRLVPPDHPLASGAIPGGCLDLDDEVAGDEIAGDEITGDEAHGDRRIGDRHPGESTARATEADRPSPAQLDLLAG
ncbi:MAG: DUF222 domain-containing protein [Acidimicrobiales bacterium]